MSSPRKILFAIAVAFGLVAGTAMADQIATQTVNFDVQEINELEVSAGSVSLTISSATAGGALTDTDSSTSYDITTNAGTDAKKIIGVIDTNMPAGVTLEVDLVAPTGATSLGATSLSTVDADLVADIDSVSATGHTITYTLTADVTAGTTTGSRTVTFTLVDNV